MLERLLLLLIERMGITCTDISHPTLSPPSPSSTSNVNMMHENTIAISVNLKRDNMRERLGELQRY